MSEGAEETIRNRTTDRTGEVRHHVPLRLGGERRGIRREVNREGPPRRRRRLRVHRAGGRDLPARSAGNPHAVQVQAVFEDEEWLHVIMELCPGPDLFDRISERGTPLVEGGDGGYLDSSMSLDSSMKESLQEDERLCQQQFSSKASIDGLPYSEEFSTASSSGRSM